MTDQGIIQFCASDRQELFADLVKGCVSNNEYLVVDWLEACQHHALFLARPVTLGEWRAWEKQEGFSAWLATEVPAIGGIQQTDMTTLDTLFFRGLARGMVNPKSQPWAYQAYGKVLASQKLAESVNDATEEVLDYLEERKANAWKKPVQQREE
jgi:hypothetical protein